MYHDNLYKRVKYQGHRSDVKIKPTLFFRVSCVRDTPATRGQYLASRKA